MRLKLRHNADLLSFLLSSPVAVKPVLKFVHTTGRFKSHFGKNLEDRVPTKSRRNAKLCKEFEALEKFIKDAAANMHMR